MSNLSPFCTCKNFDCPLHPTKHDMGCAPCISKNLHQKELPNCFFSLVKNAENRTGDTFEDFAQLLLDENNKC